MTKCTDKILNLIRAATVENDLDKRRADDHPITDVGGLFRLIRSGYPYADEGGDVRELSNVFNDSATLAVVERLSVTAMRAEA